MHPIYFLAFFGVILAQTPACTFTSAFTCNSTTCPIALAKNEYIKVYSPCTTCDVTAYVSARSTDTLRILSGARGVTQSFELVPERADIQTNNPYLYDELTNFTTNCFSASSISIDTEGEGFSFYIQCRNANSGCMIWYDVNVVIVKGDCAPGCTPEIRADGCDWRCNTFDCGFQNNACRYYDCVYQCTDSVLGDGNCDSNCNVDRCLYDKGDCGTSSSGTFASTSANNANALNIFALYYLSISILMKYYHQSVF